MSQEAGHELLELGGSPCTLQQHRPSFLSPPQQDMMILTALKMSGTHREVHISPTGTAKTKEMGDGKCW